MSGALAERDFVERLEKTGFDRVEVVDRKPWGIEECRLYPLFTPDLIELMERLIPGEKRDRIGDSIVIKARLGSRS